MHKIKFLILSFIFLCCINKVYSQESKRFVYIKIGNIEGVYDSFNIKSIGEKKYLQILNDFENKLKKYNNGYQDYYRNYYIATHKELLAPDKGKRLYVTLYPKKDVSKQDREKHYYHFVPSNTTIYKITYYFESKDKNNFIITKTLNKEIVE